MTTKPYKVNAAVLATGVMAFSGVLIETAMNVTFPTLIKQFGISTEQVQWVTTIYLLMISMIVPLSSYLTKNYSVRKLFTTAIGLFILGVAIDSIPLNFELLLLGRMLQGIATGIGLPLMFSIILTKVPLKNRGKMIGIGTLTTAIAPALGPTYGGMLTTSLGWQYIYVFLLPILLIALVIGLQAIPREDVAKTTKLNWHAALALAVMFAAFLLIFNYWGQKTFWAIMIIGIMSAVIFFKANQRDTLIDLSLFQNVAFRRFLFGFLTFQAMLLGVSFVLPNSMQLAFNASASTAGMMMFPGALIGAIFAPLSGSLLDRFGAKTPIITGLVIATTGWASLTFALAAGTVWWIILSHVIFMIGSGLAYSNLMTMGLSTIAKSEQSDGNAIFNTLQQFSGAFATAFVALVMGLTQKSASNFVTGTLLGAKIDLISLIALLVISLILVIWTFRERKTEELA